MWTARGGPHGKGDRPGSGESLKTRLLSLTSPERTSGEEKEEWNEKPIRRRRINEINKYTN